MTIEAYFEQFTGDAAKYLNPHRDGRIEELIDAMGFKMAYKDGVSYTVSGQGYVHIASKVYDADTMIKALESLPPEYGIYDIEKYNLSWHKDTHFVKIKTKVCYEARGEYDN